MHFLHDKIIQESGPLNDNTHLPAVVQPVEHTTSQSANQMLSPLIYIL